MFAKLIFPLMLGVLPIATVSANPENENDFSTEQQLKGRGCLSHDDFFINAIPKCGTHFIMRCISLLINQPADEGYDWVEPENFTDDYKNRFINILASCKDQAIIHKTCAPYFQELEDFFSCTGYKCLFQIRDPRDAIVSMAAYMEQRKVDGNYRDFFYVDSVIYDTLSFSNQITALMTGSCCNSFAQHWIKRMIPWSQHYGLVVKYEDLVGPEGNGDRDRQINTLKGIANYLMVDISQEEIAAVANICYQTSPPQTFEGKIYNRAKIGSWKIFFNEEHKRIFKEILGDELIQLGYEQDYNW